MPKKKGYKKKAKLTSWANAMIRNSEFLIWGKKQYGVHFDLPQELEEYRKKLGLTPRPKRFKI
jgi:hypothetical protein